MSTIRSFDDSLDRPIIGNTVSAVRFRIPPNPPVQSLVVRWSSEIMRIQLTPQENIQPAFC